MALGQAVWRAADDALAAMAAGYVVLAHWRSNVGLYHG